MERTKATMAQAIGNRADKRIVTFDNTSSLYVWRWDKYSRARDRGDEYSEIYLSQKDR